MDLIGAPARETARTRVQFLNPPIGLADASGVWLLKGEPPPEVTPMKASLYHLACVMAMLSVSFNELFHVGMKW